MADLVEFNNDPIEAAWRASVIDEENQPVYPEEYKHRPAVAYDDSAPAWADCNQASVWEG